MTSSPASTTLHTAAAAVTGAAWAAAGVLHVTQPQIHQGDQSVVHGAAGHVALALFSIALLATAVAVQPLARLAGRPRVGLAVGVAVAALGLVAIVSNVRGEDPAIFNVVAPLTNLVWLVGSIVLAVGLWRRAAVPRPLAVGLPLCQILALPLSVVGGPVLAGAYWLAVAGLLEQGTLAARPAPATA
jgi:hypothetical protein